MAAPAGPTWQNPRVLCTLLLVFVCGVSVGMLVMNLGVHGGRSRGNPSVWKDEGKQVTIERFKQELNLTAAQAEQLETVLDDFFMYYHTLQAQLDDVRATGKNRILRLLDDEQKRKFEKLSASLQAGLR